MFRFVYGTFYFITLVLSVAFLVKLQLRKKTTHCFNHTFIMWFLRTNCKNETNWKTPRKELKASENRQNHSPLVFMTLKKANCNKLQAVFFFNKKYCLVVKTLKCSRLSSNIFPVNCFNERNSRNLLFVPKVWKNDNFALQDEFSWDLDFSKLRRIHLVPLPSKPSYLQSVFDRANRFSALCFRAGVQSWQLLSTAQLRRTNMAVPVDACVEGSVRWRYLVLPPISLRYSTRQSSLF